MEASDDLLQRFRLAARLPDRPERTLRLAALISEALRQEGIRSVLVGGAAVEIYTRAMYTTADLDFVAAGEKIPGAMQRLRFERRGRAWVHREHAVVVEFPSAALDPGRAESLTVGSMSLQVISVEDLVVDRLAAWKHWGWHPDGLSAALLLELHGDGLDTGYLEERAEGEDVSDALDLLRTLLHERPAGGELAEEDLVRLHREMS